MRMYTSCFVALMLTLAACTNSPQLEHEATQAPQLRATTTTAATTSTAPTSSTVPASSTGAESGALTWGIDASAPSTSWTRPPINTPYEDQVYGTAIRRLTSAEGTRFNRNTYSRRQAENADGSLFMTYHGDAQYHVSALASGELVRALPIDADSEPQWHPTDPNRVRHLAGSTSSTGSLALFEIDVATGNSTVIADLTERVRATIDDAHYMIDRAEGSPSQDGSRWAWIVYNEAEQPRGIVSYDLATDTVLGITTDLISSNVGWVSMSPTGAYVLVSYAEGTYSYNPDLSNIRLVTEAAEHSDIALDQNGRDTYVYIDFHPTSVSSGWLTAVDLATLERTLIFDLFDNANTSVHVSGKGYGRPGWVVVSTYNCKDAGAWSCQKVMAVELASGGRILNLAHTYNCANEYWTETHAVVNQAFDAVYFNSDGGSCGIDAEVYRLEVPPFE